MPSLCPLYWLRTSSSGKQSPSSEAELDEMKKILYASAVECLMYAMVCTGQDLAQAISLVSKYVSEFLTKPVLAEKFKHCLSLLNLNTC